MKKRVLAGMMALLAGLLAGCAEKDTRHTRDGVQYGVTKGVFRGRWWSYYERGVSYLNGQYYDEAVADFRQALLGRNDDSWRARTYGLHFVEYFPNRELGIALFQQGKLDEAQTVIQKSLDQIDTDRGHHYIDLILKQKIAKGVVKDPDPPVVEAPPPPKLVKEPEVEIAVAAKDPVGVEEVKINDKPVPQRGSRPTVKVKKKVPLKEGNQTISLKVKNLGDKENSKQIPVTVDLTGPTIGVFAPIEPTVTEQGNIALAGATVDKNGVRQVNVGDRIVAESPGAPRLPFNTELPLNDGENTFVLAAHDVAGNETRAALKVFRGNPNSTQAKLWLIEQRLGHPIYFASADPVILDVLLSATAGPPKSEIRLKAPEPGKPYRYDRTLRISGDVVTQNKVTSLSINGEPFEALTGAPKESFNKRIVLDPAKEGKDGEKIHIAINATDSAGAQLTREFDVDVQPVKLASKETKMPVAVLAYSPQGVETSVSELFRTTSEAHLFNQGRFQVIDRTRLHDVLTEQQLSAALSDPNQALTLGKLTPAQVFVVADVFARDAKGVEIKARAISSETSTVLATLDVFTDDRTDHAKVEAACENLAAQLEKTFPRLSGEIASVRGDEMLFSWTKEDGVQPGSYVLLLQETKPWVDATTGEVLEPGSFVPVGRAQITGVSETSTRARKVPMPATGAPEQPKEAGKEAPKAPEAAKSQAEQKEVTLEKGMPAVTM